MSTKHELEKQAAQLQAELDKLNTTIASMKNELPEGFIPFEATASSKCPCHEKDVVLWCSEVYPQGAEKEYKKEAGNLYWGNSIQKKYQITGYKIVEKYVEPRLMKYSEIPVGQWFMWSDESSEDYSVYMKTSCTDSSSVCIKDGGFLKVGCSANFSENLKFYSVKSDMTRGELLTVEQPPEPVEDEYFMHKSSGHSLCHTVI